MKRTGLLLMLALLPVMSVAQAARLRMPDFSELAGKARESVDISLDGDTLKMARGFLGGKTNDAEFADAVKDLQGIYVKVFSFDQPNMYSMRDIDSVVSQVENQGWKKLMTIRDKTDRVEMWMHSNNNDGGMLFVATEPDELVLINIVGKVDLQTLSRLQGRLGVPMMPGVPGIRPPTPPGPPGPGPGRRGVPPAVPPTPGVAPAPPAAPASPAAPAL
jgi:hypothetical protein